MVGLDGEISSTAPCSARVSSPYSRSASIIIMSSLVESAIKVMASFMLKDLPLPETPSTKTVRVQQLLSVADQQIPADCVDTIINAARILDFLNAERH